MTPSAEKRTLGTGLDSGVSLVEMVIVIGLASVLIIATAVFIGRAFAPPRAQFEQGKITADAQNELERMGDHLRESTNVDWNGDGVITEPAPGLPPGLSPESWLVLGDDYEITFYVVVEGAGLVRMRYWLDGTQFKRTVATRSIGGCFIVPAEEILAQSVRNISFGVPLFEYNLFGFALPTPIIGSDLIDGVAITLVVDANLEQAPIEVVLNTEITPRDGVYDFVVTILDEQCRDCLDNDDDGFFDFGGALGDVECNSAIDNNEWSSTDTQCSDLFDNDGDTLTDFGLDPECVNGTDVSEFF